MQMHAATDLGFCPERMRGLDGACSWKRGVVDASHPVLQARGKFGLRTRAVRVHEATFIPEAEQQLLSTALAQRQRKAEAGVAAAALEVGVARWCLLHHASRRAMAAHACPGLKMRLLYLRTAPSLEDDSSCHGRRLHIRTAPSPTPFLLPWTGCSAPHA